MSLQTEISYSVAIRTLGTAGDKYEKLMNSVAALVPKPKEVVVVLPEGYEKPEYQIGCELFVRSQKRDDCSAARGFKVYNSREYFILR